MGNVVDLLNELKVRTEASSKAQVASLDKGFKALNQGFDRIASLLATSANDTKKAQAQAAVTQAKQSGEGTKTETGGVAFNPFTASMSALGGDRLRVTFPKNAELIADAEVEMYQCKFTYLKNGKLDAKQVSMHVCTLVHDCPHVVLFALKRRRSFTCIWHGRTQAQARARARAAQCSNMHAACPSNRNRATGVSADAQQTTCMCTCMRRCASHARVAAAGASCM